MRILAISVLTGLALSAAAVAQSPAPGPTPSMAAIPTPAAAYSAVVHIKNFAYVPSSVTVKVGQSVAWVEDDDTSHTVTSVDTSFDSGNMDKNGVFKHTFIKAGTYPYICAYHPYMKGTVIVK
jgi:plastocyanin